MASFIGGSDSDSSDTDSSTSSSSSGNNTEINAALIKPYGECSKEKCESSKEAPKRNTKKEQGTINKDTKSGQVKEEGEESKQTEKEKNKVTKSVKLIKSLIAKNKSRTSKVNKKLNLVLKTFSAEQRHNKAALRITRKIASLKTKKTK